MLKELNIRNLAIIDDLRVSFADGLTVISGETGAGKSIIMEAVGLLQGDRATTDWIRSSEDAAVVEALFDIGSRPGLQEKLESLGFERQDEIVIRRIISRTGKNRAYVNGSLATLSALSLLGESLVNICSQHEHQSILNPEHHRAILDRFGNLEDPVEGYRRLYNRYRDVEERIQSLEKKREERLRTESFLLFQLKEIDDGKIQKGEDEALQAERTVLAHGRALKERAEASFGSLYSDEGAVLERLSFAISNIKDIYRIDSNIKVMLEQVEGAYYTLQDAAIRLRDYGKEILIDPDRIEKIEERLEYLNRMKRKYGGTLESVLEKRGLLKEELRALSATESDLDKSRAEIISLQPLLLEKAKHLSEGRKSAAAVLENQVEKELGGLRMENTSFRVFFHKGYRESTDPATLSPSGADEIEFFLSPNTGEELKPLNRIASGGELSRITLAIRRVLAEKSDVRTMIFDEIDSGIGGAAAELVGKKLREAASHHQVLCITHLPQIAGFGENHFLVEKAVSGGRTKTMMRQLTEEERLQEMARMLGGVTVSDKAREHAREMLKSGKDKPS
ncbi:MAG TPA: DNA repair protein RecN [Syntrophales bacterium]|nr:DNA repair protein RecN [Syntrophales bacterium]